MKLVLCFIHIEKTAGTSMRSALYNAFGKDQTFWHGIDGSIHELKSIEYRVIGGHFSTCHVQPILSGPCYYASVIRHPVDRAISLFHYIKCGAPAGHPLRSAIADMSLEEALMQCGPFFSSVNNAQCAALSGSRTFAETKIFIEENRFMLSSFENVQHICDRINKRFGVSVELKERLNTGAPHYQGRYITDGALRRLSEINEEDTKLYNFVNL